MAGVLAGLLIAVAVWVQSGGGLASDRVQLPASVAGRELPDGATRVVELTVEGEILLDRRPVTLFDLETGCDADRETVVLLVDRAAPALGLLYLCDVLAPDDRDQVLWLGVRRHSTLGVLPIHVGWPAAPSLSTLIEIGTSATGGVPSPLFVVRDPAPDPEGASLPSLKPTWVAYPTPDELLTAQRASLGHLRKRVAGTGLVAGTVIPASSVPVESCVVAADALLLAGASELWFGRLSAAPSVRARPRLSWPSWSVGSLAPGLPHIVTVEPVDLPAVATAPHLLQARPYGLGLTVQRDGRVWHRFQAISPEESASIVDRALAEFARTGGRTPHVEIACGLATVLRVDRETPWRLIEPLFRVLVERGVRDILFAVRALDPLPLPSAHATSPDLSSAEDVPMPSGYGESYVRVIVAQATHLEGISSHVRFQIALAEDGRLRNSDGHPVASADAIAPPSCRELAIAIDPDVRCQSLTDLLSRLGPDLHVVLAGLAAPANPGR